jgi:hypothetical protein
MDAEAASKDIFTLIYIYPSETPDNRANLEIAKIRSVKTRRQHLKNILSYLTYFFYKQGT